MKRALSLLAVAVFVLSSCGLKVPTSYVAGAGPEAGNPGATGATDAAGNPIGAGPAGGPAATSSNGSVPGGATTGVTDPGTVASNFFNSETEGVTKDQITLCTHIPITGAAPIPHDTARFGQFYFDYVNKELGGVYGRKVRFLAYDDQYYPAGARNAAEKCARAGSFIYLGAAGTDQIVSVAKWAERKRVPYLHGPTSTKDLGGLHYNVQTGPGYEYQSRLLADYIARKFPGQKVGMIRVNSPYFDSGHAAFVDQLKKHGITLDPKVDEVVQKDEKQFQGVFFDMQSNGVQVINNMTTPTLWISMLKQKPATFDPTWTAISPIAGYNIVAAALGDSAKAEVFQHFNPACHCTYYNVDLDKSQPWYNDEQEFLRIFRKYSPEQKPPPDDFDYSAYLAGRGLYRLLLAIGPQPTRTKLWNLLKGYKETPAKAFPACAPDYSRVPGSRTGGWDINVFKLDQGKWLQTSTCTDKP